VRQISSLEEFREERAIEAKGRFDQAWSNRAQDWRALEWALDELDVAVCALVEAQAGYERARRPDRDESGVG
jgi:hypothetical protein